MKKVFKKYIFGILFGVILFFGGLFIPQTQVQAAHDSPKFQDDIVVHLKEFIFPNGGVDKDKSLIENVKALFFPYVGDGIDRNRIYDVIRELTLGIMIIFLVYSGAELLFNINKDKKNMMKLLWNFVYMLVGGCFVLGANWIFGSVFKFDGDELETGSGINSFVDAFSDTLMGQILLIIKAFAFFLAIIMLVVTGIRVIGAGDGEKGKKLVKGILNVVFSLIIIKGIDFIFYMVADSGTFVSNTLEFIKNFAKIFGRIYGVIVLLMVIVAGYLYLTDGGGGNGFKKATNILVNILLSGLVLFSFLFILYQLFSEFSTGGEQVTLMSKSINQIQSLKQGLLV